MVNLFMPDSWHQVVAPHPDIRAGKFDESVFAADLSDVTADRGPLEYRDAETFFRKTYPTQGLVNLLSAILSRIAGQGKGEAVIQIQTPFGGGKTHSLIALYHLLTRSDGLKSLDTISQVLKQTGVDSVPRAQVATFVGTAADPLKGKTPWGELAKQLSHYPLLREHDQKRRAPGKDLLHQLLTDRPTLILMDEVAEYAVKAKDFNEQVMAFFQELTETVKVLPQCVLVVTLPSSAPYGEEGERALQQLQSIFGRVEAVYTPVEGEEVYEIIRRRLFEDTPDPKEARRVADSYWEIYQRLGDDVPREVREPAYRDKLRKAYPFHPELIDILFERWSTFPTFQRTRGVLRLLAEVVADLYRREHPAPLIQPAYLSLTESAIRRELLKHIGNAYEGVIASDIADGNAKAQKIDREMGSEYARFGVASGLATAIFFGSFSGSEKKGVGIQRLRLALLREGIPPAVVGDALRRLEEELWYLHVEGGVYSFSSQPNLNRVIVEKEEAVHDDHIAEEIRTRAEKAAGSELAVKPWPKVSQDVPDTKDLKLAVLSPEHARQSSATGAFVEEMLKKCGTPFRTYQNTLLALAPDSGEFATLRQQVKRLLALRAIRDDKTLMRQLSEENKKTLESKLKDIESGIPFRILSAYRHFAKAGESSLEWFDLGLPTVGEKGSLAKRVREYLKGQELLLDKIPPQRLLQKTLRDDEQERPLVEIVDAFRKYPQLPMLESEAVVLTAVAHGVREGTFGVKVGERIYFNEALTESVLDYSAVLVRKEVAEQAKQARESASPSPSPEPSSVTQPNVQEQPTGALTTSSTPSQEVGVRGLRLRVKVPWDKLSDFVRGVVMPLRSDGADMEVEVLIQARSGSGSMKPSTLEQKVQETLNQIGAKVLEDTRE
jgi:hypothetical protein